MMLKQWFEETFPRFLMPFEETFSTFLMPFEDKTPESPNLV